MQVCTDLARILIQYAHFEPAGTGEQHVHYGTTAVSRYAPGTFVATSRGVSEQQDARADAVGGELLASLIQWVVDSLETSPDLIRDQNTPTASSL